MAIIEVLGTLQHWSAAPALIDKILDDRSARYDKERMSTLMYVAIIHALGTLRDQQVVLTLIDELLVFKDQRIPMYDYNRISQYTDENEEDITICVAILNALKTLAQEQEMIIEMLRTSQAIPFLADLLDDPDCDFAAYCGKIERNMLHKESGTICFIKGVGVEMGTLSPSELACEKRSHKNRPALSDFLKPTAGGAACGLSDFCTNDLLPGYASQRGFESEAHGVAVFARRSR